MKIEKFIKDKSNKYKIVMDNDLQIYLYDDVIVKYNLLVNKEMNENKFKEITKYNDELDSYYKAIKYINRKMRSKKEIFKYLEKDFDLGIIKKTVNKLEKEGYLNEDIYIKAYINDQVNLTLNGPYKIKKDLLRLDLSEDKIDKEINSITKDIWVNKINKIISKKIKSNHNYPEKKLKEKLNYDLCNLGYSKDIITDLLEKTEILPNQDLVFKEGRKIYQKLSLKYQEEKLKYYFQSKMYAKGFSKEEIDNCLEQIKN